ncbi:hypothetical protein [Chryseobacterium sp. GP-SGM7]
MNWNEDKLHTNVYGAISSIKVVFPTLWEPVKSKEFYLPLIFWS